MWRSLLEHRFLAVLCFCSAFLEFFHYENRAVGFVWLAASFCYAESSNNRSNPRP
jgi:hypothetical protein